MKLFSIPFETLRTLMQGFSTPKQTLYKPDQPISKADVRTSKEEEQRLRNAYEAVSGLARVS